MKNRSGSYKKVLFSEVDLKASAPLIENFIDKLMNLYQDKRISDVDFTTIYLLFFIKLKYQKNYLQQFKKPTIINHSPKILDLAGDLILFDEFEKKKLENISGLELFSHFNLKGVPQSVTRAMENWYKGSWNIKLSFKIPSSKTLLKEQAENKRILTLIIDKEKITSLILGKRDPLSFAIHDLMHADQFFNNPISLKGQLGFYRFIADHFDHPRIKNLLQASPQFKEEFEYVVSDMNAYIIHLLKSFVSCFNRINAEAELLELLETATIPNEIQEKIMNINKDVLSIDDENLLRSFFENNQRYLA